MSASPALRPHKNACSLCARRKVKCDKGDPCSNCLKTQSECLYEAAAPSRPRKRAADEELLARLGRYEDLMRKHNIDFAPYANTWVPSGLEGRIKEDEPQSPGLVVSPANAVIAKPHQWESGATLVERCAWSSLSPELKYPPIQGLRHPEDPLVHHMPPLHSILTSTKPELHQLHPEPKHIYRFWQIFVESVNPLTKIIHVPTLQPRILEASWDLPNASKSLTAIMFAIYTLAVISISPDTCQTIFNENRETLLGRYQAATLRALITADFLTTRELEVLQAFTLFLLAGGESELTSTLSGAAIRLGQKMGLHRESNDTAKIPFFEKEMRVRLWWQLRGIDSRIRGITTQGLNPRTLGSITIRLPLNVNDADLHPDMLGPPQQHKGPTEMLCVLMKFEITNWLRSSPTAARLFENITQGPVPVPVPVPGPAPPKWKKPTTLEDADAAINELENIYREKYISPRISDAQIPLHALTQAMARLAVARLRFKIHHPRAGTTPSHDANVHITRNEGDILFESAVTLLEMVDVGVRSQFSTHLFTHMTSKVDMDVYIYVISELRYRCSGERVRVAWAMVEKFYTAYPQLIEDVENGCFVALGDLTLEAWGARRKEMVVVVGGLSGSGVGEGFTETPRFIQLLLGKRVRGDEIGGQVSLGGDSQVGDGLGLVDENCFNWDWEYWADFLRV